MELRHSTVTGEAYVIETESLQTGDSISLVAKGLRDTPTGPHAWIGIGINDEPLADHTFNVTNAKEQVWLTNQAYGRLNQVRQKAISKGHLQDLLASLCREAWGIWQGQLEIEDLAGDLKNAPARFVLKPYIVEGGGTIIYGPPKRGKSYLCQAMAVMMYRLADIHQDYLLWPCEHHVPVYVNLERSKESLRSRLALVNMALGLSPEDCLPFLQARGKSLVEVKDAIKRGIAQRGVDIAFIDSISRAGLGDLTENRPANSIVDVLNDLGITWVAIGHAPREGDHIFGCHDELTEVLTASGWKRHADVGLDDYVADYDTSTCTFSWQRPTQLHCYQYQGEMVHLTGRLLDVLVTPQHRMLVKGRTRKAGKSNVWPHSWQWTTAAELSKNGIIPTSAMNPGGITPLTIEVGPSQLETETFLRYLGWWLSEGSISVKAGTSAVLTQASGPLARLMARTVRRLGFNPRVTIVNPKPRDGYALEKQITHIATRNAPWFARWLTEHCGQGALKKHLPDWAYDLAPHLRQILFEALMEGDGHWIKELYSGTYSTISSALADGFQALALSLGWSATVKQYEPKPPDRAHYVVSIRARQVAGFTANHGNSERISYSGNVYCLTVPSGAYITRRNGKPAITGNSIFFDAGADVIVSVKTVHEPGRDLGMVLELQEANDVGPQPNQYIGMQFDDQGLTAIYKAKETSFPQLIAQKKVSFEESIILYLREVDKASATTIAHSLNLNRSNVSNFLNHSTKIVDLGKAGKEKLYGVKEERYDD